MASLKDVAKRAGVSLMTVSRALNNPGKLSQATLDKVRQAVAELNYVPNAAAQSIRSASADSIGVLSLGTATTPFSVEMLLAVEKTVRQHRWHSFVINAFENDEAEMAQAVEQLLAHRPSGIIIARNGLKKVKIPAALRHLPVVLANCVSDDWAAACYVPDDYRGQKAIAKLLAQRGYKRPLFLHIPHNYIATERRKAAFEDVWNNVPEAAQPVQYFMPTDGENYFEGALPLIEMLDKHPQDFDFDVVVCGNDRIAFVVYQALLAKGFRIPQDVAVTGYDNMVGVSHLFLPPLTTVQLPHYQMGEQAALHIIENRQDTEIHPIDCPLVLGQSC
ncbi:LacI family DNA-binding transcriptional regulator [Neisseria perflava]|uniref:LacI family DNA-binding transcriptional regulator n=1 Tax=Neisseria perflava TaxID=33053 RepID=UPI0020A1D6FC|nr:LacI family DNA-binding transcriptional regulator [Neisseria perflava]MCP1660099.1 DNA-binding LacI/PurR family transcriptional regulator [Neisseria perflava]MCP1772767.1 DNA-binding LacI/PurR family transcriptional regulator [Neisseria perflava]